LTGEPDLEALAAAHTLVVAANAVDAPEASAAVLERIHTLESQVRALTARLDAIAPLRAPDNES
jgi:hypothetical protein